MELRKRLHEPVYKVGMWLNSVVTGHYRYYGVPGNSKAMQSFRYRIAFLWKNMLIRRSQKGRCDWARMNKLLSDWLPYPKILHPFPGSRRHVTT